MAYDGRKLWCHSWHYFLAAELRQNSDMIRAQTRANLAEELVDLFSEKVEF